MQATQDVALPFKPNPSTLVADTKDADVEGAVYRSPRIASTTIPTTRTDGPKRNNVLDEFITSSDLNYEWCTNSIALDWD
jgi:hypothetical protein